MVLALPECAQRREASGEKRLFSGANTEPMFFKMDLLWADVTPVPLNDGPHPPFRINYNAEYSGTMGYVRACLASGERSPRVLALTSHAVQLNPANYTVWSLRRACLLALGSDLEEELEWLHGMVSAKGCWKNYQVWQHRRVVVGRLGDASGEGAFTGAAFAEDRKNYHAWAHRQWAVAGQCGEDGGAWGRELDFTLPLLEEDVRNNSAWNHRWFVVTRGGGAPRAVPPHKLPTLAALSAEVDFTLQALRKVSRNEAAWSHLRALVLLATIIPRGGDEKRGGGATPDLGMATLSSPSAMAWAQWPAVVALCKACISGGGAESASAAAAAAVSTTYPNAFALEVLGEEALGRGDVDSAKAHYLEAAASDPLRRHYWEGRARDAAHAKA